MYYIQGVSFIFLKSLGANYKKQDFLKKLNKYNLEVIRSKEILCFIKLNNINKDKHNNSIVLYKK